MVDGSPQMFPGNKRMVFIKPPHSSFNAVPVSSPHLFSLCLCLSAPCSPHVLNFSFCTYPLKPHFSHFFADLASLLKWTYLSPSSACAVVSVGFKKCTTQHFSLPPPPLSFLSLPSTFFPASLPLSCPLSSLPLVTRAQGTGGLPGSSLLLPF